MGRHRCSYIHNVYVLLFDCLSLLLRGLTLLLKRQTTSLGAGRIRVWTKVILPMLTPSIVASSLLVFMISMASYTAPLMFGVERTMTMQIYLSRTNGNLEMVATQSMILSLYLSLFNHYALVSKSQKLSKSK